MMERKAICLVLVTALLLLLSSDLSAEEFPGGIGLSVLQLYHHESRDHRGPIVVLDVLPKGSAFKAGIEKGDIITHVDEEPTTGKDYAYILEEMLRGPAYTEVTLTIRRTSTNRVFDVTLDRVESKGLY
jgi:carboxyl-terminal processing protease